MKRLFASLILLFFAPFSILMSAEITSPANFLGFEPGSDFNLADYKTIVAYFQLLDSQSNRLQLQTIGETTEGRPLVMAIISDAENIRNNLSIIKRQQRLANPRQLIDAQARRIIRDCKIIVSINCSIHAKEIGPSQMAMSLAHLLVSSESHEMSFIRENVVLLLIPAHNPDGLDKVVDWYNRMQGTGFESGPMPFLSHKYCGHDINRDWFVLTQQETRLTVEQVYNVWRPHVVFDLHQMGSRGARMFLPPYIDPYDQFIDPIIQSLSTAAGSYVAAKMTALGHRGVAVNVYFDSFSPARSYINHHGGVRILGEIASARIATPVTVAAGDLKQYRDYDPELRSWRQPLPWPGGAWHLADIAAYGLDASVALLGYAAHNREAWLWESYLSLKNQVDPGSDAPIFIVPPEQHDSYAVYELLSVLERGLVEIHRAATDFVVDNTLFPRDSYVIYSGQPYGAYARTLLHAQPYPAHLIENGRLPYDTGTHHLPQFFGVEVVEAAGPVRGEINRIAHVRPPSGSFIRTEKVRGVLIDYRSNQAIKVIQSLLQRGREVYWLADSIRYNGETLAPGTVWVPGDSVQMFEKIASELSVDLFVNPDVGGRTAFRIHRPRIGIYTSALANMDEGWTRYILDEYFVPYERLTDGEIRRGDLQNRYDVIILPDQSPESLVEGAREGTMPPDYCGGLDQAGVIKLSNFVKSGGTLIMLNRACGLATRYFWLPVKNVVKDLNREEFYAPGSMIKLVVDTSHPIGFGMPRETAAFIQSNPVFEQIGGDRVAVYPGENILLSGFLQGESYMSLKTAIGQYKFGDGTVVLLGVRPQFRAQTRGTYKFLFNGIYQSAATRIVLPD